MISVAMTLHRLITSREWSIGERGGPGRQFLRWNKTWGVEWMLRECGVPGLPLLAGGDASAEKFRGLCLRFRGREARARRRSPKLFGGDDIMSGSLVGSASLWLQVQYRRSGNVASEQLVCQKSVLYTYIVMFPSHSRRPRSKLSISPRNHFVRQTSPWCTI